jgi:hypothetical protein
VLSASDGAQIVCLSAPVEVRVPADVPTAADPPGPTPSPMPAKGPDVEALAARRRQADSDRRQHPRRQREHQIRRRAAAFAEKVKPWGCSCSQAARHLHLVPRTLAHWCQAQRDRTLAVRSRGRPCKQSAHQSRLAVAELLRDSGPWKSVPALRHAFPNMPRAELVDLRLDYWQDYRRDHRLFTEVLTWHVPGRVWAMDHLKPPVPIDGLSTKAFSVRDLASGMVLAWQPVPDETAATTRDILLALFLEFGPPLVLKFDNGPAFKAEVEELLDDWLVTPLNSPPMTARYNGACESAHGWLKHRTAWIAAHAGRPGHWTSDDFEAARRQANEDIYDHGELGPNHLQRWQARRPINLAERHDWLLTLTHLHDQIYQQMDAHSKAQLTATDRAAIERRVIRRACVESGLLSVVGRRITLPLRPNKRAKIS